MASTFTPDRIQIACSAHAINGGILIDEDGQSNVKGLYAAGEVAGGPHGADRLGGNMAVTCQIFGRRAGRAAARRAAGTDLLREASVEEQHLASLARLEGGGRQDLGDLRRRLQQEANRSLLVVRTGEGLERFSAACRDLRAEVFEDAAIETPQDLVHALELVNLCEVGQLIATAAGLRRESRGGHYREDHPEAETSEATAIIFDANHGAGHFRAVLGDLPR